MFKKLRIASNVWYLSHLITICLGKRKVALKNIFLFLNYANYSTLYMLIKLKSF